MKQKTNWLPWLLALAAFLAIAAHYLFDPWGFYHKLPEAEARLRMQVVETAQQYLGYKEADGSHREIIDRYNAQEPLPVGYTLQDTDSWCAAFVTVTALECGLTDIIPAECSCGRQIELFQQLNRWEEDDWYLPAPGDIIYYDWDQKRPGDCVGWPDHVGIVVGTKWPFVKVIEGNKDDSVAYRIIPLGDLRIRGYGLPDYGSVAR